MWSQFLPRSDQAGWWERTFSGRVPPMDAQVDSIAVSFLAFVLVFSLYFLCICICISICLRSGSTITTMVGAKADLRTAIIWLLILTIWLTRACGTIGTACFLSTTSANALFHLLQINWSKQYAIPFISWQDFNWSTTHSNGPKPTQLVPKLL